MTPARRTLVALALVCASALLLEIALTRLFSALMFYHFTFFALALAQLGIGASGIYVSLRRTRVGPSDIDRELARQTRRFAFATLVALACILLDPFIFSAPSLDARTLLHLALLCGATTVPFLFAGIVVALAVAQFRTAIDRVYAYDLAGTGIAALAAGIALQLCGAPGAITGVALLATAAAWIFHPTRRGVVAIGVATVALIGVLVVDVMPSTKGVHADRVVFDEWNAFSRVTLEKVGAGYDIRIDASARTAIAGPHEATSLMWQADISALAYHLQPRDVLIIGPGGGIDVAHALAAGATHVTGVELNPLIADTIMRDDFAHLSGHLYADPRVTIVTDEGRSFVARTTARYDLIQATLVDTWAATATGAFALTENTLYTVEAFGSYLDHLTPDGMLSISRWGSDASRHELVRLVVLAAAALEARGIAPSEVHEHLLVARDRHLVTVIVKPRGFSTAATATLLARCRMGAFEILVAPDRLRDPELGRLLRAGAWSEEVRATPADVRPPTDDRPFFFYFSKPEALWSLDHDAPSDPALWLLAALAGMLGALVIVFIGVPLVVHRRRVHRQGLAVALGYFAALGFGFMVIELALVQRLGMILGHPAYALVVVLFALLVGAALGARLSKRFSGRAAAILVGGAVIAATALVTAWKLPAIVHAITALAPVARFPIAIAIVLWFGVAMGTLLPQGVTALAHRDDAILTWCWGINGGMAVVGTVVATVVSINAGYATTFRVGAAAYAVAATLGAVLVRRRVAASS